jgi:hypothetical protein
MTASHQSLVRRDAIGSGHQTQLHPLSAGICVLHTYEAVLQQGNAILTLGLV